MSGPPLPPPTVAVGAEGGADVDAPAGMAQGGGAPVVGGGCAQPPRAAATPRGWWLAATDASWGGTAASGREVGGAVEHGLPPEGVDSRGRRRVTAKVGRKGAAPVRGASGTNAMAGTVGEGAGSPRRCAPWE